MGEPWKEGTTGFEGNKIQNILQCNFTDWSLWNLKRSLWLICCCNVGNDKELIHYHTKLLFSFRVGLESFILCEFLITVIMFSSTNKVQGLLVYSVLKIMVQLHRANSELGDHQVAPPT